MTYKENITAILECHFGGFKEEIIDSACNRILEIEPCEYAPFTIAELKDEDMQKMLREFKNQRVIVTDHDCLPSATPKPKTGHWILLDECSNSGYYCSECHKKVIKEGWSGTIKKIKYCPNCGTKMV